MTATAARSYWSRATVSIRFTASTVRAGYRGAAADPELVYRRGAAVRGRDRRVHPGGPRDHRRVSRGVRADGRRVQPPAQVAGVVGDPADGGVHPAPPHL